MLKIDPSSQSTALPLTHYKVVAAIPCLNTQRSIAEVVTRAKKYVDEVIVIDDGSTDMTAEVANLAGATVINHGVNKGYGEAIKSCFAAARADNADVLVTIDGDGQHNPDDIPRLLTPIFREGADLVIGSRFIARDYKIPQYRKIGISLINLFWNIGSKVKVSDTQSGFRSYSKRIVNSMKSSEKGMSISIDTLEIARRSGAKIKDVPISCSYEKNNCSIGIKAFRHGIGVAFSVLRIRLKSIFARE